MKRSRALVCWPPGPGPVRRRGCLVLYYSMEGIVLTLNDKNEIIAEEKIDMEDSMYYWNKQDSSGNRYFVTTIHTKHKYKKKAKKLTNFDDQKEKDSP